MIALGVNSVYHESAAAVVVDGMIVAAAEEERFSRYKHGKPARVDNADQLPVAAIDYCLRAADVAPSQIDVIGYSFDPVVRAQKFVCDPLSTPGEWGDGEGERTFVASLARVPDALCTALGEDVRKHCTFVPHHIAHAASAYYPSGCDRAAILVVDGIGEHATTLLAAGEGNRIQPLEELYFPHSVGFLWEKISRYLGFSEYDACKVMGLAAYGDASRSRSAFERFVCLCPDSFALDPFVLQFRLDRFDRLEEQLGPFRRRGEPLTSHHADVAAGLQACTDAIMDRLIQRLYNCAPGDHLCLAGGVALNCTTNWRLKEYGVFRHVHIPPAPHDAGTAVGAAFVASGRASGGGHRTPQPSPYLGPEYSDAEIERSLGRAGLPIRRLEDPAAEAAVCLARSEIVGWFQGRLEFGPRALGNRSLLADPRRIENRTRLNESVKRRENFRPFGPSVLVERSAEWFDIGRHSEGYRYMLFACPVKADKVKRIPAVVHQDGTARIQIVEPQANPRYHALIRHFETLTGVPLVLNTSFNDSEPIVCSPDDAIRTFLATDIDVLILGDYVVRSANARAMRG